MDPTNPTVTEIAAANDATNTAIGALATQNEYAAAVGGAMQAAGTAAATAWITANAVNPLAPTPAEQALAGVAALNAAVEARNATDAAGGVIVMAEMSSAATAYGTKSNVCHYIPGLPGGIAVDTCLPDSL